MSIANALKASPQRYVQIWPSENRGVGFVSVVFRCHIRERAKGGREFACVGEGLSDMLQVVSEVIGFAGKIASIGLQIRKLINRGAPLKLNEVRVGGVVPERIATEVAIDPNLLTANESDAVSPEYYLRSSDHAGWAGDAMVAKSFLRIISTKLRLNCCQMHCLTSLFICVRRRNRLNAVAYRCEPAFPTHESAPRLKQRVTPPSFC